MKNLLIGLAMMVAAVAQADIYKCTTHGRVTFSDAPCQGETAEIYHQDTEYDIQRREQAQQAAERESALATRRAKAEQDARQVIGLLQAGRLEDARSYAAQANLDFNQMVATNQEKLREQQGLAQQGQEQEQEQEQE